MKSKLYSVIGLGGTFDHFHMGHEHFLLFASSLAQHLVIGITDQKMTKHKPFSHSIEPYSTRHNAVRRFCRKNGISCEVVKIQDIYGPTLKPDAVDALCVTEETTKGAENINQMRQKLKYSELPIHVATMMTDQVGKVLSSRRIRAGEVSRAGVVYTTALQQHRTLGENQRSFFQVVQGKLVAQPSVADQRPDAPNIVVAVGDSTLEKFLKNKWYATLAVYDGKTKRSHTKQHQLGEERRELQVLNPAGIITKELTAALLTALQKDIKYVFVDGEEDTATIVLVLILPLGAKIYYGQPGEGMVELAVTEEKKQVFYEQLTAS